jgi:hypothetical protein
LVELVHAYSNLSASSARLIKLRADAVTHIRQHADPRALIHQRIDRRLGQEMIERIVTEYVRGVSSTRLASRYGVGKGTLLRLVREHGAAIRRHGGWRA